MSDINTFKVPPTDPEKVVQPFLNIVSLRQRAQEDDDIKHINNIELIKPAIKSFSEDEQETINESWEAFSSSMTLLMSIEDQDIKRNMILYYIQTLSAAIGKSKEELKADEVAETLRAVKRLSGLG